MIDTEAVRERYAAGEPLRAIADDLGVAVNTVRARLPERRAPGRPRTTDVAAVVRLRDEEGLSFAEIGERLGVDPRTAGRRYAAAKG